MPKLYDTVKELLETIPETRNSDQVLVWTVYGILGYAKDGAITKASFLHKNIPPFESISRARRKIQELHPDLQATPAVQAKREEKELDKGMFVFHEKAVKKKGPDGHFEIRDGREVFIKETTASLEPSQGKS